MLSENEESAQPAGCNTYAQYHHWRWTATGTRLVRVRVAIRVKFGKAFAGSLDARTSVTLPPSSSPQFLPLPATSRRENCKECALQKPLYGTVRTKK